MTTEIRIGQAIKAYFAAHGIQVNEAAEQLGMSPQGLSNIIAGRRRIGNKTASKLNQAFGFSKPFLMLGEGELLPATQETQPSQASQTGGVYIPPELVQMFSDMAATIRSQQEELASQRGHYSDTILPKSTYHR